MRLIVKQNGYYFKVFDSRNLKTPLYSAEIFTSRKDDLLRIFNSSKNLVSTIKLTNYSWIQTNWSCEYEIKLIESKISYNVNCEKYLRRHWKAISTNSLRSIDYYGHHGHKKSIFSANKQIAAIDKKYFHFFNRDTIYIDLNNDEDPLLILTFTLLFERDVDNDGSVFTIDFGNFGQDRKFDEGWRPK